ncbi:hypothetical protein [uncultured Aquimarina sp.]|jgi:hypothetical protein|uniref:hypothetical protein n=1 Tax=uncultured Aquimarina sp. TaxID=575652 RepID=UPI0026275520|nr:hypothetical protein [uncultured Aquimarina sp.]
MKKSILKLRGAEELTKNEQKSINGGRLRPSGNCGGRGDIECCGTANWQCGTDDHCDGGILIGNQTCGCF